MIRENRKRRKANEDNGREIPSSINNERVLGGNTITTELVQESASKSYKGKESMNALTHQAKHTHFDPTLIVGQKTPISHERTKGDFSKQTHELYRDNNTSKNARNRIESNPKRAFTAQPNHNQNISDTQSNRKYISPYTDAYKSNTYWKNPRNQHQYNITKIAPSVHHSKSSPYKISQYHSIPNFQSKEESYPNNTSHGELQEKSR